MELGDQFQFKGKPRSDAELTALDWDHAVTGEDSRPTPCEKRMSEAALPSPPPDLSQP